MGLFTAHTCVTGECQCARIADLEAELLEAKIATIREHVFCEAEQVALTAERAAHAQTKAELTTSNGDLATYKAAHEDELVAHAQTRKDARVALMQARVRSKRFIKSGLETMTDQHTRCDILAANFKEPDDG